MNKTNIKEKIDQDLNRILILAGIDAPKGSRRRLELELAALTGASVMMEHLMTFIVSFEDIEEGARQLEISRLELCAYARKKATEYNQIKSAN